MSATAHNIRIMIEDERLLSKILPNGGRIKIEINSKWKKRIPIIVKKKKVFPHPNRPE